MIAKAGLVVLLIMLSGTLAHPLPAEISASTAEVSADTVASAKRYCSTAKHAIMLSADRRILCFDGEIGHDLDVGIFNNLKQRGLFVIRSPGGYAHVAMKFANILRDKDATVILYDHCLSACANYVLVATNRTYVTKDTIIAWHRVPDGRLAASMECRGDALLRLDREYREEYGEAYRSWHAEAVCLYSELALTFFRQRQIDERHTQSPQTPFTKKMVSLALSQQGNEGKLFWMWHPKNHGDHFKSRIIYESYPSEDVAAEFARRAPFQIRLFYDPDPDS